MSYNDDGEEEPRPIENESLISRTETQLDKLYTENYKLKSNIRSLEYGLSSGQDKTDYKKIRDRKDKKESEYDNNMRYIITYYLPKSKF